MLMPLNADAARAGFVRWVGALLACAMAPLALAQQGRIVPLECDVLEVLVDAFDDPVNGRLVPTTGGQGLGLGGVSRTGLNTTRLMGSDAFSDSNRDGVRQLSEELQAGDHFLCTNAVDAPAAATATVIVFRAIGEPRSSASGAKSDTSPNNQWLGGTEDAIDAFYHSVGVRDWLSERFGMDSFDDRHSALVVIVDEASENPNRLEASYSPLDLQTQDGRLVSSAGGVFFSSSVPGIIGTFASAPDIVAHEWAHGIANGFSRLNYARETGALEEAFADWMGTAYEQPDRDDDAAGRWLIGERIQIIRDMRNPLRARHPDTYFGFGWQPLDPTSCPLPEGGEDGNDNCYIHTNNGVGNKMFQLLSDGGVHNGVRVAGLGLEQATEIAMDAQRYQWTANTGYLDARAGMVAVAATISTQAKTQTELAWRAVCVATPRPPACPVPNALQALRVQVTSDADTDAGGAAHIVLSVPALVQAPNDAPIGRLHLLGSLRAGLSAAEVMSLGASQPLHVRTAYPAQITDLQPDTTYTIYALLDGDDCDPGPMLSVPVRLGETAPALHGAPLASNGRASTMTVLSGMDGTAVHLVAPVGDSAAPTSARALFEHGDACPQAVSAGVAQALAWDGLTAGTDYVWHAVVVQSVSRFDGGDNRGSDSDIPGYYASSSLSQSFRTAGTAPAGDAAPTAGRCVAVPSAPVAASQCRLPTRSALRVNNSGGGCTLGSGGNGSGWLLLCWCLRLLVQAAARRRHRRCEQTSQPPCGLAVQANTA